MKLARALVLSLPIAAAFLACSADPVDSQRQAALVSGDLVISQVYGGGGNASATYQNDFVELFNRGAAPVQLFGYSIQYASTSGVFSTGSSAVVDLPTFSLQPGQYFLVKLATGGSVGALLPTADATGTIDMSGTNGKVALVLSSSKLTGCGSTGTPCAPSGWIDFVGYGTAQQFEGSAATGALTSQKAALRAGGGCVDTGDNAADFTTPVPSPRNSASALAACVSDAGSDATVDVVDATIDASDASPEATADSGADVSVVSDADPDAFVVVDANFGDGAFDAGAVDADLDGGFVVDADLDGGFVVDADLDGGFVVDADLDGGFVVDADLDGGFVVDAGFVDSGPFDAGFVDSGSFDASVIDAGFVDADVDADVDAAIVDAAIADVVVSDGSSAADAASDSSVAVDAATQDAATQDAATQDAALDAKADGAAPDGSSAADSGGDGSVDGSVDGGGCSCNQSGTSPPPWSALATTAIAALLLRRIRRRAAARN